MWRGTVDILFLPSIVIGYLGPQMGVPTICDDGKNNLDVDWDRSDFTTFTCMSAILPVEKNVAPLSFDLKSLNSSFNPRTDLVYHKCMNEEITYDIVPPLRGNHRPNWARYGEYLYLPEQRWLHNLEHGAVILLYHPCANEEELAKLRQIVTKCIYRHIITPYNKLSEKRPLALVTWGSKLEMNYVDVDASVAFIKSHARIAPEDLSKDGIYDQFLIHEAVVVSDQNDSKLCSPYT